ncbi:MAG: TIGR03747 family integrating conjugative element membrane protein [Gammaproteobacteria bacterium]|nr:TIGR03747 family integrating conjugative element membrane protein [Gammaproteobacteria bacterium]
MADDDKDRKVAERPKGFIRKVFESALGLLSLLLLTLMISVILEWLGMAFFWNEEGAAHSHNMLQNELAFLQEDFRRHLFESSPAEIASYSALVTYEYVVVKSGYLALSERLSQPVFAAEPTLMSFFKSIYTHIEKYITATINILLVFVVRLMVILLSLPIIFLVGIAAFVDGLVQRDLRRFGGGREFGMVYHGFKAMMKPILLLPILFYLAAPISIHPNFVFVPAAALLAMAVFVTTSTFKKYL